MPRLLVPAFLLALLSACAGTSTVEQTPPVVAAEPAAEAPEPVERLIPADSLYPLLVAEFALRRRDYDTALEQYLEQARVLRDPGVSAHATHIAQFLQREPEALQLARLWVELEPDNTEANNTLATLLVRQGQSVEALPHLAVVARAGEEANFPILLSGFEQLDPDRQRALAEGIDRLAAELPGNTQLMLAQALILAQQKQFEPALARLEQLFELQPDHAQALLLESKILLAQDDPRPFARIERVLEKDPGNQRLRLQYARLLTVNDLPAARRQFEILSSQSPRDGDLLLSLALINREIGDDLAAAAYLRQMLALGQRTDEANYHLGRIAEDAGNAKAAIRYYDQVQQDREMLSAAQRTGTLLLGSGQLGEFHDSFEQRRRNHPAEREQLYALEADLLTEAGELEAALGVLNQGLQAFPDSNALRYTRSMVGEQRNDLAMMERDLRNIIERDPDNATALNALGYTLANRTDRYDEAFELITRALALQPDEPAILDSMGWVLYRRGDYAEALTYLTRAYARFPDPEVAAHLGEVLWVSGDTKGAAQVWQGALLKAPDHKVLVETIRRLGATAAVAVSPGPAPQ